MSILLREGFPTLIRFPRSSWFQKKKKVLWKPRSSVNTQTIGVPYPWEQENNDGHAAMPEL